MMLRKRVQSFVLLAMCVWPAVAQRTLMSPYSRYGYGVLESASMGGARAMGGLGYGMRSNLQINQKNPASYTAIDSLTFMMELGVSGSVQNLTDGARSFNQFNGSLDYVAFQLPLAKWAAMSFGVSPYSSVGYEYSTSGDYPNYRQNDSVNIVQTYAGDGGLSQVYLGVSFDILDRVAIGANAHYMFGKITHTREVTFPDETYYKTTDQTTYFNVNGFTCDLGIQYHQPIREKDMFALGFTYSFKLPLKVSGQTSTFTNDTLYTDPVGDCDYPMTIAGGASYHWNERALVGVDVSWQQFSNAQFLGETNALYDRLGIALGGEYVHKPNSKKYYENMRFRLGANYANSYVSLGGNRYREYAVMMGIGFPIPNSRTLLNFLFEYGRRDTKAQGDLSEQYFKFGLGVSLNERWFVKRKIK
ncbi:MAG: hypothetical protein J5808_04365 [Paludibacteraceae bacterium]|nr:hypothetical protein [Paludibacteraceae bacterium]